MQPHPNEDQEEDRVEIDRRKLFVTNIPFDARHDDLYQFFQQFGKITEVTLIFQKNEIPAAAVVVYENEKDACEAMYKVSGNERIKFRNHVLRVEFFQAQHRTREFHIRKRVDREDAKNIYNTSLINTEAAKQLCHNDGYGERTYYNIIEHEGRVSEKYKNPDRSKKWDRDDINRCVDIIEHHPTYTLQEIERAAENAGNPHVTLPTLESYLRDELITYKKVQYQTVDRNSPATKAARVAYVNSIESESFTHDIIYIDEVGYSIGTRRTRGRAPIGQPAIVELPALQSQNCSVCCAISGTHGLILHRSIRGSFTGDTFRTFIVDLVQECKNRNIGSVLFIFDNCPIHRAAQLNTLDEFARGDFEYRFLPPYSPNLNPIENVFGFIKLRYYSLITTEYSNLLLQTSQMPHGMRLQQRQLILDNAFERSINSVSNDDVRNAYGHLHYYFNEVRQNHNI